VQTLYGKLKLIGGEDLKIWLDKEQLEQVDSASLKHNVEQSLALLVFLSEGYLTAEFCQTELSTAHKAGIPIIVVCDGGVTEDTLDKEIQQFKGEDKATLRAMEKLKDRVVAQWRIEQKNSNEPVEGSGEIDQCHPSNHVVPFSIQQENSTPPTDGGGEIKDPVLWWSRDFVRVALKGVFQQLFICSNSPKAEPGSPPKQPNGPSKKRASLVGPSERSERERSLPKLLFHDELQEIRKLQGKPVSLFVSSDYPSDRSDELKRAFKEAETNLNITVKISSSRDGTADQHSVLLLYPGFFRTQALKHLTIDLLIRKPNTPAPFLLYSTDMSADMSEHKQEGTRMLGASIASKVFRPMWSAWPEVSSLQTVAAEERLRSLSRAAEGTPHRASPQTVELLERGAERWKLLASKHGTRERWKLLASSIQRRSSRAGSRVGVQYVPEP
jgi:hypothetical protein